MLCNACGIYYSRHHSLPKRKKVRERAWPLADYGGNQIPLLPETAPQQSDLIWMYVV